jgi:hypothetical protein
MQWTKKIDRFFEQKLCRQSRTPLGRIVFLDPRDNGRVFEV